MNSKTTTLDKKSDDPPDDWMKYLEPSRREDNDRINERSLTRFSVTKTKGVKDRNRRLKSEFDLTIPEDPIGEDETSMATPVNHSRKQDIMP